MKIGIVFDAYEANGSIAPFLVSCYESFEGHDVDVSVLLINASGTEAKDVRPLIQECANSIGDKQCMVITYPQDHDLKTHEKWNVGGYYFLSGSEVDLLIIAHHESQPLTKEIARSIVERFDSQPGLLSLGVFNGTTETFEATIFRNQSSDIRAVGFNENMEMEFAPNDDLDDKRTAEGEEAGELEIWTTPS